MGTITAQSIIDDGWELMNDTGVRWIASSCLKALSSGQREIVMYLPSSYTLAAIPTLVAGSRQTLAGLSLTTGLQFLDMTRNYASNGTTVGPAITRTTRDWLDDNRPGWHSETGTATIQHYCTDPRDPKACYVWPPSAGSTKAEVIYSAAPASIATLETAITLDDIYANPLMYFLLFRMSLKNKPGGMNPANAQMWYSLMLQSLGVKDRRTIMNETVPKARA